MQPTQAELERAEQLMSQGASVDDVMADLATNRGSKQASNWDPKTYSKAKSYAEDPTASFAKGALKGVGEAGVSMLDLTNKGIKYGSKPFNATAAFVSAKVRGKTYKEEKARIDKNAQMLQGQRDALVGSGYKATKAEDKSEEGGKIAGELITWVAPQLKVTKAAKGMGLTGRLAVEGTGGAGIGYALGGENRNTDALLGGIGGIGGEFLGLGISAGAKHSGKITSLRDVFGKRFKKDNAIDVKTESNINIEKSLLDTKTGKTIENQGIVSKVIDTDEDLLSVADKRILLETKPEVYKKYKETLAKTEGDAKAPTLHETGIEDLTRIFGDYKAVNKEAGERIGKIKDKLAKTSIKDSNKVDDAINKFKSNMEKNNVLVDGDEVVVVGNSAFTGSEGAIKEISAILKNIKNSGSMNELLQGMKQLENKVIFGRGDDVSQSLQGVAKTLRSDLKSIRDEAMSTDELADYKKYADTVGFITDFEKGNLQNKLSVLLNSSGSMRSFKIKNIAKEIKRVTGEDIEDIGLLINTFMKTLPSTNRNVSRLTQIVGSNVPLSTYGVVSASGDVAKNVLQKMLGSNIIQEMDKAGLSEVSNAITNNILK